MQSHKETKRTADSGGKNLIAAKTCRAIGLAEAEGSKSTKKISCEDGIAAKERKEHKKGDEEKSHARGADFLQKATKVVSRLWFSGADDLLRRS